MRRRVFVVAGEYSESPRHLKPERRAKAFFAEPRPAPTAEELTRLFFRFPNRGDEGRTRPEDWQRAFGTSAPVGLSDLFASAAHRALTSLHGLAGGSYRATRDSITDLFVTSMPGLEPNEKMNVGLMPQALRAQLGLSPRARAQFVVGTSDSGAWTFAQAVRTARHSEQASTIVVLAGQIIPAGYVSQYQIRTVLGEGDQAQGLDMLAVGDLLMDVFRRNLGLGAAELTQFLERVAARKHLAGANYPAGIQSGKPFRRDARRTPWFDASDIAVPCCGAAATIITSDEELVENIATSKDPRFRTPPVTEVLGVGEGSSNQNFLARRSPIVFATAVREALADTADDASLPASTFGSAAFGVVHDAFPSIELSFLLAMGLGWERAAERMAEGWSNPVGGLLTFGHALGASGLVQVNKAHHVFCVDHRYVVEEPGKLRQGFRGAGAHAFTTSVGGPLSHIVGTLLRGGYQEVRPLRRRANRRGPRLDGAPLSAEWRERRKHLRHVLPSYLRGVPGALLVESTTWVSIRSCLRALGPADLARLQFDGLEELVLQGRLPAVREQLRATLALVQQEADRVAMFDVFRVLNDEVREIAAALIKDGQVLPAAAEGGTAKLAGQIKECLRVPLVVLCKPAGERGAEREVRFLPQPGLDLASLRDVELISAATGLPVPSPPEALPFWNARAARPASPRPAEPPLGTDPSPLLAELAAKPGSPRTAADLDALRLWFTYGVPPALRDRSLRAAGVLADPPRQRVRAVFYLGEVAAFGTLEPEAAHEVLARAAREARAFLEAYESSAVQLDPSLSMVAFERPPWVAGPDEALLSAARFALEVSRAAIQQGIAVRAAICAGEGTLFEDVNGQTAVASAAAPRASALLGAARSAFPGRAAFALEGGSAQVVALLEKRLAGWTAAGLSEGAALWLGPQP